MFSSAGSKDNHLISENGKLAALTSGRPAFQEHAKHAEGSDTTHLARSESTAHRVKKQQHHQVANRSRSPAGPRRLGTATRMSASLFRRLSTFFWSTSDQGQKAAKFAVLPPGRARFPKRAERSEGNDTTPIRNAPCFGACALVCDLSLKAECVPAFACKSEHGPFVREVENAMRNGWEQRCDGNFLAIFAGVSIGEKSNFTGRFFEWRRPFDFSTR